MSGEESGGLIARQTRMVDVAELQVGDVVETADGFDLYYMRVTERPTIDTNGSNLWVVVVGEQVPTGDPGELYMDVGQIVDVVVS